MRKEVMVGLVAGCLASSLTHVMAETREPQSAAVAAEPQSTGELLAQLRFMNLQPAGAPQRVGHYYVLQATDTRGRTFRVVADGELGHILSVFPMREAQWRFEAGPRIIRVPDAAGDVAALEAEPDAVPANIEALPPVPRVPTQTIRIIEMPSAEREPAPVPARASAPDPLSPIYPTPKFGKKNAAPSVPPEAAAR